MRGAAFPRAFLPLGISFRIRCGLFLAIQPFPLVQVFYWCGHLNHVDALVRNGPKVTAGLAISGVFDLAALRDSPHVNDKLKLTEGEIETLSPMRLPSVNKPLSIAYGTGELPAMIASSRDYHAYRSQANLPGDLVPVVNANHFTILDGLRLPNSNLTRSVLQVAEYKNA